MDNRGNLSIGPTDPHGTSARTMWRLDASGRPTWGTPHAAPVALPRGQLAARGLGPAITDRLRQESAEAAELARQRVHWVRHLQHTSRLDGYPAGGPAGWYYLPRPNAYGDQLHSVVARHALTGIYHVHYWTYEADLGNGRGRIDLPRVLGRHPGLTQHRTHMYKLDDDAVLCLSTATYGGLPSLTDALTRALQWSDGIGEVVRGRPFPYR